MMMKWWCKKKYVCCVFGFVFMLLVSFEVSVQAAEQDSNHAL
jgi:hypothetical protein